MTIEASVICDSIAPNGIRLTTFKLRYPKFIHGEFMTHRVFSRNASSSRAIPTSKLLEEVRSDELRATPVYWGKNQKGMQAAEELVDGDKKIAQDLWRSAALRAADNAELLLNMGVHKQIVNRILEPFSHINVIVSSTEYPNFFGLRLDKDAQPEIRVLAQMMWKEYTESKPKEIGYSEWHLPFITSDDIRTFVLGPELEKLIKISVARCARVSYQSFETGKVSTLEEDLKLYDRLLSGSAIHASPAEHQATPDMYIQNNPPVWGKPNLHGNFTGWIQHRKELDGESCAPLPKEYE